MTLATFGLTVVLAGGSVGGALSAASAQTPPVNLEGTSWRAVEVVGTPVPSQSPTGDGDPHLVFGADGRVSGSDGCNRLTGPYTVKGNGLTFGQLAGTMMACPQTDETARRFQSALKGTSHYRVAAGRLEFYGATGKPLAVFVRRDSGTSVSAPTLEGTSWQLVKFVASDARTLTPDDRSKYTIEFASGGRLAARVDCNRGRGTWKATGSQLELGPLALTRAKCPDGSMHDRIVKQWGFIRSYVVKDGHLYLSLMADGGIYEFEPVAAKNQESRPK